MNLVIEHCDFFEDTLLSVMQVLHETINKEDRNYEDDRRIKNILDDLDNFNISFILEDLDIEMYTMLLSMRNISVSVISRDDVSFKELRFPINELEKEYERLIIEYMMIRNELKDSYNMTDKELEYIEPNSKLVTVRVSTSIKNLLYFILSCSKYDETVEINLLFSNYSELMESMVTIALSLTDLIKVDDMFIRVSLEEDKRHYLLNTTDNCVNIISDEEYINYCKENGITKVNLSVIGTCSLVAYREMVDNTPKQSVKIENFYEFINQENFSITLPVIYSYLDEDLSNTVEKYIYDWFNLVNNLKQFGDYRREEMLCCLGCYNNIFKSNMALESYYNLRSSDVTEISEIIYNLEHKMLN